MIEQNKNELLRQCDTGEINCFTCIGRDKCELYPNTNIDDDTIKSVWNFYNTTDDSFD